MDSLEMLTFRAVRPGEIPDVIGILEQCGLPTGDLTLPLLKNFLVARKNAAILGVAGLDIQGRDALLRSLAVAEGSRKKGIGSKLVASAERYACSRNVETLYLLTLTAEALFHKAGFAVIDRKTAPLTMQATREFRSLCPVAAVCMRKEISP